MSGFHLQPTARTAGLWSKRMALFTGPYANPLRSSADLTMQTALDATRQTLSLAGAPNVDSLALIVVALTGFEQTTNHPWAGLREHEEHPSSRAAMSCNGFSANARSSIGRSTATRLSSGTISL